MGFGGLFLSWSRPSQEQQKACIADSNDTFNYEPKFRCATSSSSSLERALSDKGFFVNRSRLLLGSGPTTFSLARSALLSWRHFALPWAFVDPNTPLENGARLCVCLREFLPIWIVMPLKIAYVTTDHSSFAFGSGTLSGHLLAGEERFAVEWDENDQVWYDIFSFSKPAHLLSVVAYPYVQFRQKLFAQQSGQALLKHITAQQSTR